MRLSKGQRKVRWWSCGLVNVRWISIWAWLWWTWNFFLCRNLCVPALFLGRIFRRSFSLWRYQIINPLLPSCLHKVKEEYSVLSPLSLPLRGLKIWKSLIPYRQRKMYSETLYSPLILNIIPKRELCPIIKFTRK